MQLRRLRWAAVGLVVVLAGSAFSGRAEAGRGLRPVGTLERFAPEAYDAFAPEVVRGDPVVGYAVNGTLLPVPQADQLWQLYQGVNPERTGVLVRDADTLRVEHSFLLQRRIFRSSTSVFYGGEWLHATDGGRRVFLLDRRRQLLEVDTATFAVRELGALSVSGPASTDRDPVAVAGMTWDAVSRRLLVLYGGPPNTTVANRLTVLQEFDPATGARRNRVLRSCTGPLGATDFSGETYDTAPLADGDAVYVPCQQDTFAPGLGLLSSSIVVRLPRAGAFEPTGEETAVVVGGPMNSTLLDHAAARITVLGWTGELTVVDARTMTVVGSFDAAPGDAPAHVGAGLDPTTGRVYFQSTLGLGRLDARATPPPPPTVVASAAGEGQERIMAQRNRLYVLPGHGNDKPDRYSIHRLPS